MNNYKFGNYICKLREEKGFTQAELAQKLDVSDKAVSKWENGQAIPRMDTFEKLAETLATTIEDILSASKDETDRICIVNNFCSLMTIDVNGQIFTLSAEESRWIETSETNFTLRITGDILTDSDFEEEKKEKTNLKEKVSSYFGKKALKYVADLPLQANCVYNLKGVKPDSVITVEIDIFSIGDKALTDIPFIIAYPKIICDCEQTELIQTKTKNKREVIKKYCGLGALADLGLGFFAIIASAPIRSIYFRYLCNPRVLKKKILKADYYHQKYEKESPKSKKPAGCLAFILITFLLLIFSLFIKPLMFIESEKPVLVSADHSTITVSDDVYVRIDELPEYVVPITFLGGECWLDARTDGLSRLDQLVEDSKAMQYEDYEGKLYIWLVEDYTDSILTEEKEYDDFEDPYVYVCENPDKSVFSLF